MAKVRILSGAELATLIEKNITANGTYNASADDADGYSSVNVNVQPNLYNPGTITENGTYTVPAGYDGFASFTVNVQPPAYNCIRVFTHSTGGSDASMDIQEGTYQDGVFTPSGSAVTLDYRNAGSPVSYFNTISLQYQSGWKLVALIDGLIMDGIVYNTNDLMAQWSYDQSKNFYVLKP